VRHSGPEENVTSVEDAVVQDDEVAGFNRKAPDRRRSRSISLEVRLERLAAHDEIITWGYSVQPVVVVS
jgi:hypothetical protein